MNNLDNPSGCMDLGKRHKSRVLKPLIAPACKDCPWRCRGLEYDADGLEALLDGYDASCHAIVGGQRVFADQPAKDGNECRGPFHFDTGAAGYRDATAMRGER